MKRITTALVLALVAVLLVPSFGFSKQSNRLALIIGNGAYKSSPLKNPTNDAYDMAQALKELGFQVIHKENAGQRVMEKAIRDFGKLLRKGGMGLFYFAGHGMQVNDKNYLIPIGAEIYEETDIKYEAVDADRILDAMHTAGNSLNIVILDACRDNPFARSFRTSARGLARMDAPTGTLISYSTAPGMVAADGEGRNSVYTKHLLRYITTPSLNVEQVLKKVRVEVIHETGSKQVPWEASSLTGDFYFSSEKGIAIVKRPTAQTQYSSELEKQRENLERERQELERLKMEIEREKLEAERKRLEADKKKIAIAKKEIGRDGNFIKYDTGVVYDKNTGLEWVAGPDRKRSWYEAKRWVEDLNIAGGGWRMPTIAELKTLHKRGTGSRNMTPLLKTTGWWVWSGETKGSSEACFLYFRGFFFRKYCYDRDLPWDPARGFAVRFRR